MTNDAPRLTDKELAIAKNDSGDGHDCRHVANAQLYRALQWVREILPEVTVHNPQEWFDAFLQCKDIYLWKAEE